ncbi:MAG: protein translocase subunit SecF [bacterium]|nr:protein translocase subunit SecF [bacterium]
MKTIPFIKFSRVWIWITLLTFAISLWAVVIWGLKPGIDFTGGSLMELSFSKTRPTNEQIQNTLAKDMQLKDIVLQKTGDTDYIIRTNFLNEDDHQKLLKVVREQYGKDNNVVKENRFETIGAAISKQLRSRAVWAIIFVCLGIVGYVAFAFRQVSRPVASWKYGVLAIVSLLHDVFLVMGVFAALGHYYGVEVDTGFVVAILTVLGYSVNDTIVVYDRIRENLIRHSSASFEDTVNDGLNQTLMRSINTTMKTTLPLFALFFLGGMTIHNFTLALIIGIISGAYSSIFIASPMLVYVEKWQRSKA